MLGGWDICATSVNHSQQLVSCGGANGHDSSASASKRLHIHI